MDNKKHDSIELDKPIQPGIYPVIDNDLARDNIENDIPAADLEDLQQGTGPNSFPLGVYPVFDDDVPRDNSFDNFPASDLKDLHPYPRGLR